mgnify:CR=1 FL=1
MSAPVYYLAGATRDTLVAATDALKRDALARWRLDAVLADCTHTDQVSVSEIRTKGPDGNWGAILCAQATSGRVPDRLGYYPDTQQWERVEESDLWIGLDPNDPPGPEDLMRIGQRVNPDGSPAAPFVGHFCRLADGREWEVPVVRRPDPAGLSNLPQRFVRVAGKIESRLLPRYQAIWGATQKVCRAFFPDSEADMVIETEWAIDLLVQGLALNYRFDWALQNRLGLLGTPNWERALGSLVDYPTYEVALRAIRKKKAEAAADPISASTSVGSTETSPIIDPAAAS